MKSIEYFIKNILLKLLILFSKSRKKVSLNFNSHSKILFIRLNRIGDALITTTLLHIVKSKLKCSVYVLADKKNYFIFKNNPSVDDVIIFDKSLHSFSKINNLIKEKNARTKKLHPDLTRWTITFKYKTINIGFNILIGKCSRCKKTVEDGEIKTTNLHHDKYDWNDILAFTRELCLSCHRKFHKGIPCPTCHKTLQNTQPKIPEINKPKTKKEIKVWEKFSWTKFYQVTTPLR